MLLCLMPRAWSPGLTEQEKKLSSDLHTHAGACPYPQKQTIGKHSKRAFKSVQEKASSFYVASPTDSTVATTDMRRVKFSL